MGFYLILFDGDLLGTECEFHGDLMGFLIGYTTGHDWNSRLYHFVRRKFRSQTSDNMDR
jgi:hypothetical protein